MGLVAISPASRGDGSAAGRLNKIASLPATKQKAFLRTIDTLLRVQENDGHIDGFFDLFDILLR
jgi:hypothetical protein